MGNPDCASDRWADAEGAPSPLGATWSPRSRAWNFALFTKHATGVTLLLYGADDVVEPLYRFVLDHLTNKSGRVWHFRVREDEIPGACYYAYRVDGPFEPAAGWRFDADKILLDPYARGVFFPPAFDREAAKVRGSNDGRAPLGVLEASRLTRDWVEDCRLRHSSDSVIYEMHVRGFTRRPNSGVPAGHRGTFAGVIDKIPYLKDLGVTVVELLPVFQGDPQEANYWGYMPLSFFAPNSRYAVDGTSDGTLTEMRQMVAALHEAGIEVVLDVVYNHTVESDEFGPTYSYRGIDNSTYYLLQPDRSLYRDDAGTGNVLHTANVAVRKMVIDSMRFWAKEMHVDGFRFDLASIFTRRTDGSIDLDDPPIISSIDADPDFQGVRLIAEAWDLQSYQLGRRFPGVEWYQWNDRFRDEVRAFVRGDRGTVGGLMTRIYGSSDQFPDGLLYAYHAFQSVNLVTTHDGFCLYDLVAYNQKRNLANGQQNLDGSDNNNSWNCGWEGDHRASAEVLALRGRQVRNFCCLLFLANGTPMLCAGDEFLHTQGGNNNPYNQDNETTWLDWDRLEQHRDVHRFFKMMIAFRKRRASIGRSRFWRDDVRWFGTGRQVDWSEDSHQLAYCLHGASQGDRDLYVMINAGEEDVTFSVQEGSAADWRRVIDTGRPSPEDIVDDEDAVPIRTLRRRVAARSIVVLLRDRGTPPPPPDTAQATPDTAPPALDR